MKQIIHLYNRLPEIVRFVMYMVFLLLCWSFSGKYLWPYIDAFAIEVWHLGEKALLVLFPTISHDGKLVVTVVVLFLLPTLIGVWMVSRINKAKLRQQNKNLL